MTIEIRIFGLQLSVTYSDIQNLALPVYLFHSFLMRIATVQHDWGKSEESNMGESYEVVTSSKEEMDRAGNDRQEKWIVREKLSLYKPPSCDKKDCIWIAFCNSEL